MDSSSAPHHLHQEMGSETLESMLVCSKTQQDKKLKPPMEQPQKCPRCDSTSTKFCYYNNYSLSQPRYFCKSCRRYWTKGGTLRNVPVGGGCRKNNKRSTSSASSSAARKIQEQPLITINSIPLTAYDHPEYSLLSENVLGNHAAVFGSFDGFKNGYIENPNGFNHNMYYGNMGSFENGGEMVMGFEDQINGGNNNNGVVKQEICNGENRVLWGLPWQINGDVNMVDLDYGRQSWNGFGNSTWHGLINSPLM